MTATLSVLLYLHPLQHTSDSTIIHFIINPSMLRRLTLPTKCQRTVSSCFSVFDQRATQKLCRDGHAMRGTLSRRLHTTSRLYSSGSLFNLSGLSTSREAGFLSKERGIPRTEFAPHLELIRLSEVEPFAKKKLPTDSLQPSHTSSQKLIQQSDGSGLSVAYLIKELESTRVAKEEAERLNRESGHKIKVLEGKIEEIWDRLAALSIFAAVGSILGLYYRRELYDFLLQFSPSARELTMASNASSDLADIEESGEIPVFSPEGASPPTPAQDVERASFWRRMFWAY